MDREQLDCEQLDCELLDREQLDLSSVRLPDRATRDNSAVNTLITLAAVAAGVVTALTAPTAVHTIQSRPGAALAFLGLTIALQLFAVDLMRTAIGVSAIGFLAAGFALGPEVAVMIAFCGALVEWIRSRGLLHRAIFNAANFMVSIAAASAVYGVLTPPRASDGFRVAAATLAGIVWQISNTGLLCLAISVSESVPIPRVWQERFHWARYHFLAFGPLGAACAVAYDKLGVLGLLAFALPAVLMSVSVRQYVTRTEAAAEEVRRANAELSRANTELAAQNDDLHSLFLFAGGLAARTHDRDAVVAYGRQWLARVTGGEVEIRLGNAPAGLPLVAGGERVGGIVITQASESQRKRWERLADAVLPQLATALESAELVEEVRRRHLATIAALSRSMEAKDNYTGGHTERVSEFAVALASRLGYSGAELGEIEIGALLHDIGKIGIPERILDKPGPLDDDEWAIMREHPVISASILGEADLPELVVQIARHHHERIDGRGYPDGLAGDEIPLPARIVKVADAFDALTTDRPYRRAHKIEAALDVLRADAGTDFCPIVVAVLQQLYREEPALLGVPPLRALEVA